MNNLQLIVKDNTRAAMHMAVELCEQGDFDSVTEAVRWLMQERDNAATLGSKPDETELTQTYDAGFRNGVMAVFQQLEGIEDYEGLQELIAEYWGEGEGNDDR